MSVWEGSNRRCGHGMFIIIDVEMPILVAVEALHRQFGLIAGRRSHFEGYLVGQTR